MTLCIHNVRVVTPGGVVPGGVLAGDDGRIAALLAPGERPPADREIDGGGRWLLPGFIDADPAGNGGDFAAAAVGGVTTVLCADPPTRTHVDVLRRGEITAAASPADLGLTDPARRAASIAALAEGSVGPIGSKKVSAGIYAPAILDLAVRGAIGWERAAELLAGAAARLCGIEARKGRIAPGADADLVLVDDFATRIAPHGTPPGPLDGFAFRGWPMLTVLRGRVIAENEKLIAETPSGEVLTQAV